MLHLILIRSSILFIIEATLSIFQKSNSLSYEIKKLRAVTTVKSVNHFKTFVLCFSQTAFPCSKLPMEPPEKYVKSVQS